MSELLHNETFFYAVAFVIFLALVWRYGRKPAFDWIDTEILKIRHELDQAKKLRAEAEATLAEYKAKQAAAMADAENIIKHAKAEAERLKAQAEKDLKDLLMRQEQHVTDRIRMAETEAMAAVRDAAVDAAMGMVRKALASNLDSATAAKLVDQAIADMPKSKANKAKAA